MRLLLQTRTRYTKADGSDCGGVSTPGHGQGEGPARNEFRDSGTKEIVGGAEVSVANGVLRNPCHPPGLDINEKRVTNQSY